MGKNKGKKSNTPSKKESKACVIEEPTFGTTTSEISIGDKKLLRAQEKLKRDEEMELKRKEEAKVKNDNKVKRERKISNKEVEDEYASCTKFNTLIDKTESRSSVNKTVEENDQNDMWNYNPNLKTTGENKRKPRQSDQSPKRDRSSSSKRSNDCNKSNKTQRDRSSSTKRSNDRDQYQGDKSSQRDRSSSGSRWNHRNQYQSDRSSSDNWRSKEKHDWNKYDKSKRYQKDKFKRTEQNFEIDYDLFESKLNKTYLNFGKIKEIKGDLFDATEEYSLGMI